jgi:acyl-CoA thioesterase YciA
MPVPAKLEPAIRVVLLPRDTNQYGTIFGGVILSYLDQAGLVEARKHAAKNFVTVALREVDFVAPVFVGDLVSFYTRTLRIGRTSMTVKIWVEAHRCEPPRKTVRVTEAEVTYVAVNNRRKPIPIQAEKNRSR